MPACRDKSFGIEVGQWDAGDGSIGADGRNLSRDAVLAGRRRRYSLAHCPTVPLPPR
jgi:hypothetical protein